MSLATLLQTVIDQDGRRGTRGVDGDDMQAAVITALEEQPLRVEVWEEVKYNVGEGVSIADVHTVLDGLIKVLKGEAVDA